jgi:hypothetical protein
MTENKIPLKLLTKQEFAYEIEKRVKHKDMEYLEAISDYCDSVGIEVDEISKLVVGSLKAKLEAEARSVNLLPRSTSSLF